jgi:hypothetical protein
MHSAVIASFKYFAALAAATVLLGACAQEGEMLSNLQAKSAAGSSHPSLRRQTSGRGNLYVLNGNTCPGGITVYTPGQTTPARSLGQCPHPFSAFAFDPQGNLYAGSVKHVFVYAPGASVPARKFSDGKVHDPWSMISDFTSRSFVANLGYFRKLSVFSAGDNKPIHSSPWIGPMMMSDHRNRIYVGGNPAEVLSAGGRNKIFFLPSGTSAMTLDLQDNAYIAQGWTSTIFVYKAYSDKILEKITNGVNNPDALAFDAQGNLYCANNNNVAVFAPGSSSPNYSITDGVNQPNALAIGPDGNLYVSNLGANTITVYAPGSTTPWETISNGISNPLAIAFGP